MRSRYEDLTNNADLYSRRLIAHAGLEWDEACARHYEADSSVRTLSTWQVRQPVYQNSVNRWKLYEMHLAPLKQALGELYSEPET